MFSSVGSWIIVIYTFIGLAISVIYYFKIPQYHTTRTLLALIAFVVLALAGLFVLFLQTYLPLAIRAESRLSSSIAIFSLAMVIFQALVVYPQSKRQGKILLVPLAIFAVMSTIYTVYTIYIIVTSISH